MCIQENNVSLEFKPPLTIQEQLDYIEKEKHVVYNCISKRDAATVLEKYGYINVITPFKYLFAKREPNGEIIKVNNKHVYEREVDFQEYYDAFLQERGLYPDIYKAISTFEATFNAVVAYECIQRYNLKNSENFDIFIEILRNNILSGIPVNQQPHMLDSISKFRKTLNEYDSIYIFMDRLSLNETVTVFRNVEPELRNIIFNKLRRLGVTFGTSRITDFLKTLSKLVQIRNCVYHGNSLVVLIRYYKIKTKAFRKKTDRKSYNKLIRKLAENGKAPSEESALPVPFRELSAD